MIKDKRDIYRKVPMLNRNVILFTTAMCVVLTIHFVYDLEIISSHRYQQLFINIYRYFIFTTFANKCNNLKVSLRYIYISAIMIDCKNNMDIIEFLK